jgi:predicted HicB family RNase H-like nuclease
MSAQPQVQYAEPSHGFAPAHKGPSLGVVTAEADRPDSDAKGQECYRVANQLYQQGPDWVTFFREVLGVNGCVRTAFPTRDAMDVFEASKQYEEIQLMLAKLRERNTSKQPSGAFEPTRVITVRLPKSLHESLRAEAHEKRTSMNKLCISKLLQFIDADLVPTET